jgi:hypothetical protein
VNEPALPEGAEPLLPVVPGFHSETEWNVFRREWPRLLAEGQEGRWALINGEEFAGTYAHCLEAVVAGWDRFNHGHFFLQPIHRKYQSVRVGDHLKYVPLRPVRPVAPEKVNYPPLPEVLEPLPDMVAGSGTNPEWDVFRREWPRWLREGQEGRWALIKGEEVIGIFDSQDEARDAWFDRFENGPILIHQILRKYRTVRAGNYWRCLP